MFSPNSMKSFTISENVCLWAETHPEGPPAPSIPKRPDLFCFEGPYNVIVLVIEKQ